MIKIIKLSEFQRLLSSINANIKVFVDGGSQYRIFIYENKNVKEVLRLIAKDRTLKILKISNYDIKDPLWPTTVIRLKRLHLNDQRLKFFRDRKKLQTNANISEKQK